MADQFRQGYANLEGVANPDLSDFKGCDKVTLTEAENAIDKIRRWGDNHGFKVKARKGVSTAVLIRKKWFRKSRLKKLKKVWWWGKDRWHLRRRDPRKFWVTTMKIHRKRGKSEDGHGPPGGPAGARWVTGGKNAPAWKEFARKWKRRLRRWKKKPRLDWSMAVGDLNAIRSQVKEYLKVKGYKILMLGKVDGILYRGMKLTDVEKLDGPGHGWAIATFVLD